MKVCVKYNSERKEVELEEGFVKGVIAKLLGDENQEEKEDLFYDLESGVSLIISGNKVILSGYRCSDKGLVAEILEKAGLKKRRAVRSAAAGRGRSGAGSEQEGRLYGAAAAAAGGGGSGGSGGAADAAPAVAQRGRARAAEGRPDRKSPIGSFMEDEDYHITEAQERMMSRGRDERAKLTVLYHGKEVVCPVDISELFSSENESKIRSAANLQVVKSETGKLSVMVGEHVIPAKDEENLKVFNHAIYYQLCKSGAIDDQPYLERAEKERQALERGAALPAADAGARSHDSQEDRYIKEAIKANNKDHPQYVFNVLGEQGYTINCDPGKFFPDEFARKVRENAPMIAFGTEGGVRVIIGGKRINFISDEAERIFFHMIKMKRVESGKVKDSKYSAKVAELRADAAAPAVGPRVRTTRRTDYSAAPAVAGGGGGGGSGGSGSGGGGAMDAAAAAATPPVLLDDSPEFKDMVARVRQAAMAHDDFLSEMAEKPEVAAVGVRDQRTGEDAQINPDYLEAIQGYVDGEHERGKGGPLSVVECPDSGWTLIRGPIVSPLAEEKVYEALEEAVYAPASFVSERVHGNLGTLMKLKSGSFANQYYLANLFKTAQGLKLAQTPDPLQNIENLNKAYFAAIFDHGMTGIINMVANPKEKGVHILEKGEKVTFKDANGNDVEVKCTQVTDRAVSESFIDSKGMSTISSKARTYQFSYVEGRVRKTRNVEYVEFSNFQDSCARFLKQDKREIKARLVMDAVEHLRDKGALKGGVMANCSSGQNRAAVANVTMMLYHSLEVELNKKLEGVEDREQRLAIINKFDEELKRPINPNIPYTEMNLLADSARAFIDGKVVMEAQQRDLIHTIAPMVRERVMERARAKVRDKYRTFYEVSVKPLGHQEVLKLELPADVLREGLPSDVELGSEAGSLIMIAGKRLIANGRQIKAGCRLFDKLKEELAEKGIEIDDDRAVAPAARAAAAAARPARPAAGGRKGAVDINMVGLSTILGDPKDQLFMDMLGKLERAAKADMHFMAETMEHKKDGSPKLADVNKAPYIAGAVPSYVEAVSEFVNAKRLEGQRGKTRPSQERPEEGSWISPLTDEQINAHVVTDEDKSLYMREHPHFLRTERSGERVNHGTFVKLKSKPYGVTGQYYPANVFVTPSGLKLGQTPNPLQYSQAGPGYFAAVYDCGMTGIMNMYEEDSQHVPGVAVHYKDLSADAPDLSAHVLDLN